MALELNKLTMQVADMGRVLAERRDDDRQALDVARAVLARNPQVGAELQAKIARARQIDEWRRGALPAGDRLTERQRSAARADGVTLLAADGSQIYPDRHGIAPYFLINIGAIVLRRGSGQAPMVQSSPEIFFEKHDVYDPLGQLRPPDYVNTQRARREIAALADLAERERTDLGGDLAVPIIALTDGLLLPWMRREPGDDEAVTEELEYFVTQLRRLRGAGALPVGYVDRPASAYVLRILELIELRYDDITRDTLRLGPFRQLTDRELFGDLGPGERSALFSATSDANDRYEAASGGDRVMFAYLNVSANPQTPAVIRIELPGWVARDPARLDLVQAAICADSQLRGYPYVLDRAHELAVVSMGERAEVERMVGTAMIRHGLRPALSVKAQGKQLTK